ncbi:hypothetical protein SKAU_G00233930 [Synaphobranchus kaupii]|uniref:Gypsy retrotransposon integrase-like protein 1 n=1 Tax=Synaphobranchus kaupii TaxID=118154 RepID=A0A9Q1F651_SYNKA|nr:hypothetical protein SKAU_G00233930 [Synaphobranchus kaupii]
MRKVFLQYRSQNLFQDPSPRTAFLGPWSPAHSQEKQQETKPDDYQSLAHTHLLGAHLGVEKTLERIKTRFYWPGAKKAVEDYCRSCPDCQQVAPRPHLRSPLIPLPIISVPFSRIGMDLVGPLPRSSRGHQ